MNRPHYIAIFLAVVFSNIGHIQTVEASPCTLMAAPDGRYHYLRNRDGRTVSAYVYWKQASTLVQTIQGLFDYGVCIAWAKSCLNGICQGVPACDIRQQNERWAIFRDGVIFSPWISAKEGGKEYLSEIFSVYKSGHICYEQATTELSDLPAISPSAPIPTAQFLSTPPEQAVVPELIILPTSSPTSVETLIEPEAQVVPTSLPQAPAESTEENTQGAIPTMDLIQAPVDATAANTEEGMDPESLPAAAFSDDEVK